MRPVHVVIFHAEPAADAGPLVRGLAEGRLALATRQREQWLAAGADKADIVGGPPDALSFGERLRQVVAPGADGRASASASASARESGGLVVAGSGTMPLARVPDLRRFVEAAAGPGGHALANNRYSADVVAISRAADLADLPPLPSDNGLPRWLEERAGVMVADLGRRWRLGVDVDTPLDLLLLEYAGNRRRSHSLAGGFGAGGARPLLGERPPLLGERLEALSAERPPLLGERPPLLGERLEALSAVLRDRRAELLVAGRVSTATLQFLQRGVACRVRALVEERGLRAASALAQSPQIGRSPTRPPRSVFGELLDRDGPDTLARHVAGLADAAVIDTRVLMAHRFGAAESAWPEPEDRFASDLLDAASIRDPWLGALTSSASGSPAPILFGGHTLVNGGLRLLAERATAAAT